jgi:hypothetical protein
VLRKRVSVLVATIIVLSMLAAAAPSFAQGGAGQGEPKKPEYHIRNMHTQPWFWEVMFASTAGWILGLVKGLGSAQDWLSGYFSTPRGVYFALDFLIFAGLGAYLGTAIFNPGDMGQALTAGLSWPLGFGALIQRNEPSE